VNVFFASGDTSILKAIGGLALDSTWTGLYVTVQTQEGSVQVLHLYLNDDDDEPLWDGKSDVVYEWKNEQQVQLPGPIVVDQKGHLFVGINNEVVVMDEEGTVISTVSLPARATSLTLGQDGFLYVSSSSDLYRIKVRNQPLKVPTNMIKKKQTTK
jgi:sugar lactone lactonase YvrE